MTLLTLANFLWRRFHLRQQTMATMPTTRRRVEQTTDTMVMIIVILFRGKGTCCITLADSGTGSEKMQTLNACSSDDYWNGSLAYKWDFLLLFMCTMYFIPNNTSITISTPKFRIKPIIPVNKRLLNRSCKSTITKYNFYIDWIYMKKKIYRIYTFFKNQQVKYSNWIKTGIHCLLSYKVFNSLYTVQKARLFSGHFYMYTVCAEKQSTDHI